MIRTFALALGLTCATQVAQAGSIATIGDWESECAYMFTGVIEAGDADKVNELETYGSAGATLCFDSPGGSMSEGLKMFELIWNSQMRTLVKDGDRCESACAIAWLGGSESHGTLAINDLSRGIEPGATLGFHAPSLPLPEGSVYPARDVERAFLIALNAAEGIFQINLQDQDAADPLNNYLYGRILATPGNKMHRITTIGEALMANISVYGLKFPEKITRAAMLNMCENAYLVSRGVNADMGDASTYVEKQREWAEQGDRVTLINDEYWAVRLDGQRRRQYGCKLDDQALADFIASNGRFGMPRITLFYVHVWPGQPAEDVWTELKAGNEEDTEEMQLPFYALYEANVSLRSLAD